MYDVAGFNSLTCKYCNLFLVLGAINSSSRVRMPNGILKKAQKGEVIFFNIPWRSTYGERVAGEAMNGHGPAGLQIRAEILDGVAARGGRGRH